MHGQRSDRLRESLEPFVGVEFRDLGLERELNPKNYQLARQVVQELLHRMPTGYRDLKSVWVTVPLDPADGAPREPTPIYSRLDFDEIMTTDFESSEVARRLRAPLLVPVVKPDVQEPAGWWISEPALWEPDEDQWARLEADYELIREAIASGRHETLSSGSDWPGEVLVPKTNGANAADTHTYVDQAGRSHTAKKYGYYVRPEVVSRMLDEPPKDGPSLQQERFDRFVERTERLAELDRVTRTTRRQEQGFLRSLLLGSEPNGNCSLCGRSFPREMLVAAHVKPRAQCSAAERRDVPAVVMLACRFGCDELYERGWLTVDESGTVRALEGLAGTAGRYLAGMEGRKVSEAWPRGEGYFRWHRENVWIGRAI